MNEDRVEGTAKKIVGVGEEVVGKVAGDEKLEAKGYLNQAAGAVQDGYGKVRDKVKDLVDDAAPAAKDAIGKGRDYARRGSAAVARTAGDNTALMLLGVGLAGAAIGWLTLGRKRRGKQAGE